MMFNYNVRKNFLLIKDYDNEEGLDPEFEKFGHGLWSRIAFSTSPALIYLVTDGKFEERSYEVWNESL